MTRHLPDPATDTGPDPGGVIDQMHNDEIRARLGLRPAGRRYTITDRIVANALAAMPEPYVEEPTDNEGAS